MKLSGHMPDVTPVQVLALLTWIVTQAVAYGYLDTRYSQVVLSVGGTVIVGVWKLADAIIRNGRAKAVAAHPATAVVPTKAV